MHTRLLFRVFFKIIIGIKFGGGENDPTKIVTILTFICVYKM